MPITDERWIFAQYATNPAPVRGPRSFNVPRNLTTLTKPLEAGIFSEAPIGKAPAPAPESDFSRAIATSCDDTTKADMPAFRRSRFNADSNDCSVPSDAISTDVVVERVVECDAHPMAINEPTAINTDKDFAFIQEICEASHERSRSEAVNSFGSSKIKNPESTIVNRDSQAIKSLRTSHDLLSQGILPRGYPNLSSERVLI